ncbi:MAG TPA: hypothetical protein VJR70_03555 [Stellaceae bacterium]|nr:hypothetical protein [Stellaceae bacterium]
MADDWKFQRIHSASDHRGPGRHITKITHSSGFIAYAYMCSLERDWDGAPRAYGLDNPHPVNPVANPATAFQRGITRPGSGGSRDALDHIGNAADPVANCEFALMHPNISAKNRPVFRWVGFYSAQPTVAHRLGLSVDERSFLEARGYRNSNGQLLKIGDHEEGYFPVIQPDLGKYGQSGSTVGAPGFYVSTTSTITDAGYNEWEQLRYVDASEVPYAAWAGWWGGLGVQQGDFGLALRPDADACSGFVFADAGSGRVGEVSGYLLDQLGGENEPIAHVFLVFPHSGTTPKVFFPATDGNAQQHARINVMKMNGLDGNVAVTAFLALGADLDKFNRYRADRMTGSDTAQFDWSYPRTEWLLKSYGFVPSDET